MELDVWSVFRVKQRTVQSDPPGMAVATMIQAEHSFPQAGASATWWEASLFYADGDDDHVSASTKVCSRPLTCAPAIAVP